MEVLTAGAPAVTPREVVEALGLRRPVGDRPRVVAAMIASADGRTTVAGRSVGLGHPEDRGLLRELRAGADAVLAGAATLRAERYATLLDPEHAERRRRAGLPPHPVVATVSRRGDLAAGDVRLFGEPGVPVAVYTEAGAPGMAGAAADVTVHELGEGRVDFPAVLRSLRRDHGVEGVACEGGPALLRELVAQGCLDDLLLTVAPLLVAGGGPTALTGPVLDPPARLALRAVHRSDHHLFLHYAVAA